MSRQEPKSLKDISRPGEQLAHVDLNDLIPLPPPYDKPENQPGFKSLSGDAKSKFEATLDDTLCVSFPKPASKEEEEYR